MKKKVGSLLALIVCAAMLYAGLTASLAMTVSAAVKTDGAIDLQKKALIIPKGKKTAIKGSTLTIVKSRRYQVKAKFGSTTVSTRGTYKSSKPAIVTVSSTGLVTAKAPGTATIKVTYNGKTQSFKVKVIASHTHAWKTLTKATCKAKGKKLCQTCGATGTTAKAKHEYITKTNNAVEGRGKAYAEYTIHCNGCNVNMTNWTKEQRVAHQSDINGVLAGTSSIDCLNCGTHGAEGVTTYPKYVMVQYKETYCKTCGVWKDSTQKDLYEGYYDDYGNFVKKVAESDQPSNTTVATQSSKGTNIVLEDTESDVILADDSISDADVIADDTISTDAPVISDNTAVSDNNTDITDPNGGSDIVFEDDSFDDEEDSDSDGVLVIEDDDEEVIEDE